MSGFVARARRAWGLEGAAYRLSAGAAMALIAAQAHAQTASQITPPSFAPPANRPPGPAVIATDIAAIAPEGSDKVEVRLGGVTIEGGALDDGARRELTPQLTGRTIKVSEIFAAAHALEIRYARAGQVLTRVVVPAQPLGDGATLRLVVVQGFIERVDTSRVPRAVAWRIATLLQRLTGDRTLDRATLERQLLLAADTPGVTLRSTLAAGSVPGAAVLVIEAEHRPVTAFLSLDNTLSDALGRNNFGLGVDLNSALGAGESIYLRASGLPNTGNEGVLEATPRNRALAAGLMVPIGGDGLTFNAEITDARASPRHPTLALGFGSHFERLSWRLRYPLVRSRGLTLGANLAFDAQQERLAIVDPLRIDLSYDRLRILRARGDLRAYLAGEGTLSGSVEASFGLAGLGARTAADATALLPLSRDGTDADFRKIEGEVRLSQPLGLVQIDVQAHAQTSFGDPLANSEQIGIATSDGISPLPSGTLQGDAGAVARSEIRVPWTETVSGNAVAIAPYGFVALGAVRFERPTLLERGSTHAYAYGAGLQLGLAAPTRSPSIYGTLEYGRASFQGLGREADRISFSIVTQF